VSAHVLLEVVGSCETLAAVGARPRSEPRVLDLVAPQVLDTLVFFTTYYYY